MPDLQATRRRVFQPETTEPDSYEAAVETAVLGLIVTWERRGWPLTMRDLLRRCKGHFTATETKRAINRLVANRLARFDFEGRNLPVLRAGSALQ